MDDDITLAMIVKNEAENLKNCLESVRDQVDEIVIVDTGSTDATVPIARQYTGKIYSYPWGGDFSAARNFALARSGCAWILSLDADEALVSGTGKLKRLIGENKKMEAYLLPINNPTTGLPGEYNRFHVLRLFKNNERYRFQGKIHEQIVITESGVVGIAEGPVISHKALSPGERNSKRGRNIALLKEALAQDPLNRFWQYYLGVEWLMLGKPALALSLLKDAYQHLTDNQLMFRSTALRYLIICLQSLGKIDEGLELCKESSRRYPEYTDIYYLCGVLLEQKKDYRQAVQWLGRALERGTPPVIYSHLNGAGGFLACYHLGYCYDMLGERETANYYYERAISYNPAYIYPVFNLFLNLHALYGPVYTFDYLKKKGYLERVGPALDVANLFFMAGYPGLARSCLEEITPEPGRAQEHWLGLGKYNIYSGRLEQGLELLARLPAQSPFYLQAQTHRVLAMLLQGSFHAARALSVDLWKYPAARCQAAVLLALTRLMEEEGVINCPRKVINTDVLEVALDMLNQCSRYLPGGSGLDRENRRFMRLVKGLEKIIEHGSCRGYQVLAEYYLNQARSVKNFLSIKFALSEGGT